MKGMATDNPHILFYVEDPGAANYTAPLPAALAGSGVASTVLAHPSITDYLTARGVEHHTLGDREDPSRLLEVYHPSLLACGTAKNPDTFGLMLIAEARNAGLPSIGLVDTRVGAGRRFLGRGTDPLGLASDWLLVPDPWTRQDYLDLGFPAARVKVCGHPHNDFLRTKRAEMQAMDRPALRRRFFPGATEKRPVVLFACERLDHNDDPEGFRNPDYTFSGWGDTHVRVQVVLEEILDAIETVALDPWLVLRLHPKNTREHYARYLTRVQQVSRDEPVFELTWAADRMLGLSSMLLEESLFFGVPTLAVLPRPSERSWLPCIENGFIPSAANRTELATLLPRFLYGTLAQPSVAELERYFIRDATAKAAAVLASLAKGREQEGD